MKILKINVNSLLFSIICLLGFWLSACEDDYVADGVAGGQKSPLQGLDLNEAVKGVVKVKFKRGAEPFLVETRTASSYTGMEQVDVVTRSLDDVKMERVFSDDPRFRERHKKYDLDLWYEIRFDENADLGGIVAGYTKSGWIDIVQPVYHIAPSDATKGKIMSQGLIAASETELPFNDPLLFNQWHYDVGEYSVQKDANISVYKAWEVTAGSPDVIVAVVDFGIDVNHEDLAANMWVNKGEIAGNGIDDDGNGMVDDVYGYNFFDKKGEIKAGEHGTHVAGTVGAVNNNGKGLCGVAGGSGKGDGVRMISCQIFSPESSRTGNTADAIRYAADNGAVICQCSWGFPAAGTIDYSELAAIDYFTANAGCDANGDQVGPMKGGVAVFAMGNDGAYGKFYPACYDKCIGVAATNMWNKMASYSNYHEDVDIVAPGGEADGAIVRYIWSTFPNNKYGQLKGTSMACPHVSGVAALVVSKMKGKGFTRDHLVKTLYASCQDMSKADSKRSAYMGKGLIKADVALRGTAEVELVAVNNLKLQKDGTGYSLVWTVRSEKGKGLPVSFNAYYSDQELNVNNYHQATRIQVSLDTVFEGMTASCPLPELQSLENMFFVVAGVDAWGRESEISNLAGSKTDEYELKAFPNPVRTTLNLSWGEGFEGGKTLTIYDMASRKVMQHVVKEDVGMNRASLDMTGLAAGKYILEFKSRNLRKTISILKI